MTETALVHNGKVVGCALAGSTLGVLAAGPAGAVAGGLLGALIGDAIAESGQMEPKRQA